LLGKTGHRHGQGSRNQNSPHHVRVLLRPTPRVINKILFFAPFQAPLLGSAGQSTGPGLLRFRHRQLGILSVTLILITVLVATLRPF
jgi:hypothetical protein